MASRRPRLTWPAIAAELRRPAPPMPPACRQALEQIKENTDTRLHPRSIMAACIHIERMMHRNSIAVTGEYAAGYALLKLIPSGLGGAVTPTSLNLALALDVSGSMYDEDGTGVTRLQRVQEAAIRAIGKLRPEDTLAVVGFAHNARVLLPPTPLAEKQKIEDILRRIDTFDIDPGGTAMDEGLALALTQVEASMGPGKLSQVVVLTDGETAGEQNCRALARKAAEKKIPLTLMGVGVDWKASLLQDLANLSRGNWYYIDVSEAKDAERIFATEFETLAAAAFMNVELTLRPTRDVAIRRIRQVVPEIREVKLEPGQESLLARLGTLQHDGACRYILDLNLPKRADGKYAIAHLELTYDLGTGQRESSGTIPLEITYSAAGGPANAEVMKYIDQIQLSALSEDLTRALERNDQQAALQVAQQLEQKSEALGKAGARKTQLAKDVIEQLTSGEIVDRKMILQVQDEARKTSE
jgi:Ca-activated chloride channel family protein